MSVESLYKFNIYLEYLHINLFEYFNYFILILFKNYIVFFKLIRNICGICPDKCLYENFIFDNLNFMHKCTNKWMTQREKYLYVKFEL